MDKSHKVWEADSEIWSYSCPILNVNKSYLADIRYVAPWVILAKAAPPNKDKPVIMLVETKTAKFQVTYIAKSDENHYIIYIQEIITVHMMFS